MQLATFSLDKFYNLVVTFPVFIVPLNHKPFNLYKIETVPIPINDQDDQAHSFSKVETRSPILQQPTQCTFKSITLNFSDAR